MPTGADPAKRASKATKATKATKAAKATKATGAAKVTEPTAKKRAAKATSAPAAAGAADPTVAVPLPVDVPEAVEADDDAHPRRSRARAILVGVVIGSVVAMIAVLLMGDDGSSSGAPSVTTSTSATVATTDDAPSTEVTGSIPDDDETVTTAKAPSKSSGSTKSSTTTTVRTPTVMPVALAAPKAGRYPIKVVSSGREATGTLVISSDGWQRRELGDAGEARTEQLSWSGSGARLVASGEPGEDGSCRWDGRSTSVPSDLRDGRSWSSRVTCKSEVDGHDVKVVRVEEAKVTKRARTQLAGTSVDTWVIERKVSVTIRAEDFTTTSVSISTELFAPGLGLPVYSTSRTDVPLPDGGTQAVYASEEVLGLP